MIGDGIQYKLMQITWQWNSDYMIISHTNQSTRSFCMILHKLTTCSCHPQVKLEQQDITHSLSLQ
jgi:hypothetical protein